MPEFLRDPEVWVLIGFVIFLVAAWKPLKRAVVGGLDSRILSIRRQIEDAANLRREAAAMLAEAETRRREAAETARQILVDSRTEIEMIKSEAGRSLEELLARREQTAIDKINQAEASALAEVRRVAVDIVVAATRRILAEQVKGEVASRMLDQAIAELPGRLN